MGTSRPVVPAIARVFRSLLIAMTLLLTGCADRRELQVVLVPWIGFETLTLASDFGWLSPRVTLHRVPVGGEVFNALLEGRAVAGALSLEEALILAHARPSLRVALVMDESAGADMLLTRPGIASVAELAHRPVAFEGTGATMLLLQGALRREGLSLDDVEAVDLSVEEHLELYRDGRIDAAVTYMPYAQDLIDAGAQLLFDSRSLPGSIFDVLVVDMERLRGRESMMRDIIAAHFRALEYLRRNRDDATYRIAGYQGLPAAIVQRALGGVRLPDVEAVRAQLASGGAVSAAAEQLRAMGVIDFIPDTDSLLDDSLLPAPVPR